VPLKVAAVNPQVEDAQRSLKAVQVEKYDFTEHDQNFWCYCCKREVKKHITNGSLAVLYGGLLEHFVSSEHLKQTNKFWWENKADVKLKDKFILSDEAYEKFKTAVAKAVEGYEEKEDEYIKQEAEYIREVEQRRQEVVQAAFEVGFTWMSLNSIHGNCCILHVLICILHNNPEHFK
ncbi:centrosomal AT-AC splicing factor-like, partial [Chiloscyllium plagiosum]|uniref:centrosomal AT-AC splicing factor-like n=1 Tax=Chiloscyllium plagiosum TaxID=36176 RepID=UPI001CB8161B